ncbi:hypothetical protein A9Q84_17005 [Halobacteriovorax marinus]|uniref:Uncharacterized protein n=1 Tax=Halobacteriovorax marinus TaxID=97084 RepID=A0A1Y5F9Z6_9BACT|nr:hypothetical protein A9Q84_17005 [Halobacteriovorax marinus]
MKFIVSLIFILINSSFAGSGICSPDEAPKKHKNFCISPYVQGQLNDPYKCQLHSEEDDQRPEPKTNLSIENSSKMPALIYYAVDPVEPYMISVIDYEIKKLRQACRSGDHVNWVAFLNSHYLGIKTKDSSGNVTNNPYSFIYCGQRSDRYEYIEELSEGRFNVAKLPTLLAKSLEIRRGMLLTPGIFEREGEEILFQTMYGYDVAKPFYNFPLSHPDFLFELTEEARKHLFPSHSFTHFIHMKSHGSPYSLLTGLTKKQEDSKYQCQEKIMKHEELLMNGSIERILETGTGLGVAPRNRFLVSPFSKKENLKKFNVQVDQDGAVVCKDDCDNLDSYGVGNHLLGDGGIRLGNERGSLGDGGIRLGDGGIRLGTEFGQLGATDHIGSFDGALGVDDSSLGVFNSFGTSASSLIQVLTDLTKNSEVESPIGFIMFESCESQMKSKRAIMDYKQLNLPKLKAFYSANGSLWYRNLNWHYLLEQAQGDSGKLQSLLIKSSLGISNKCIADESGNCVE